MQFYTLTPTCTVVAGLLQHVSCRQEFPEDGCASEDQAAQHTISITNAIALVLPSQVSPAVVDVHAGQCNRHVRINTDALSKSVANEVITDAPHDLRRPAAELMGIA
jgi:hypothetical protein